jgi:epsilon-lactone hydrolase
MSDSGQASRASADSAVSDAPVKGTWTIGPRVVPPPAGASKELCAILAGEPAPRPLPTPATVEEFKALVAMHNKEVADKMPALAAQLKVKIEESEIQGVPVYHLTPSRTAAEHAGHLFVFVHGGAFVFNAGLSGVQEGLMLAAFLGLPVISIDYRMPPEHSAPAAVDDIITVWRRVTAERPAATTVLGGTSAGGNLTLASTLRMKELGLGLPSALFVGTPEADLNKRGDSLFTNAGIDNVIVTWDGLLSMAATYYAGDLGFDHPHVSPILGDFTGFPPTYLISGTRDLFLSNTVRVHRRLRAAGVVADLHVYEGFSHGDYDVFPPDTPECAEHYKELNAFLLNHLSVSAAKARG